MATINTSINIRNEDGTLIDLKTRIIAVKPVTSQPSIIDEIAKPSGEGFYTGDVKKKVKRAQVDSKTNTAVGGLGGFVGATSQNVHSVPVSKTYREDNIVVNEIDIKKLSEGKGDLVAMETGDFIITGRELDLKLLLADAKTKAAANLLHTAFDANTKPTGAQTAQAATTLAGAIAAIDLGTRVVQIDAADLDKEIDTRLKLLRKFIAYLNTMGSVKNPVEELYLFSINGHSLDTIKVIGAYEDVVKIKEKDTTNFINVNGSVMKNITGMVGYIDNMVKVMMTNQMPADTVYAVMTDRVFCRDLDQSSQYIGKVRDAASVVDKAGKAVNLKPNEKLVQFFQGRTQATLFQEEIFFLDIA